MNNTGDLIMAFEENLVARKELIRRTVFLELGRLYPHVRLAEIYVAFHDSDGIEPESFEITLRDTSFLYYPAHHNLIERLHETHGR